VHKGIQQALSLNPDLPEAYLVEGRLHERSKDPHAAIQSFEKAIALNPSYSDAYVYLGQAAMSAGLESKVWDALDTAKQLDPVSSSLLTIIVEAATTFERPEAADEALDLLQQLQPEAGSILRARIYMQTNEIARAAIQLEKHVEKYPGSGSWAFRLAYLYAYMGMTEKAGELSPRIRMFVAAQQGRKDIVMPLMEELAAQETDPHDRADVYWMSYVKLGMFDEALAVLADLWYGYAEEQMGPRMDGRDVYWFAVLLQQAGREDESKSIIKVIRDSAAARGITDHRGLLYLDGKLDELLAMLNDRADKGNFEILGGQMYADYPGIEKHPDYAALAARAEAWREKQFELYQSLKIADE
jgi:tetratricopeptide (TPR) repeat protein